MIFTPVDSFPQDDKICYCFEGIKDLDPRTLKGQTVLIDGVGEKEVLDVGTYAVNDPTGFNFGLVVEE